MNTTQLLVQRLLENADRLEWSIQGLGMLRTYLSREVRLHIWHNDFAVPNVSRIHDHPWDLESEVVCGALENRIWAEIDYEPTHTKARIQCGIGGHLIAGSETPVCLTFPRSHDESQIIQKVIAGERYRERAAVLHETIPENGTVTIVTRTFRPDTEHATVCYPLGTPWVSAEPRPATNSEVAVFVNAALAVLRGA